MTETIAVSRFMSFVDTSGECWNWQGSINGSGYGTFQDGSPKGVGAHRWSYAMFNGEPGRVVRHKCRNRSCVKPTHLDTGTYQDNARDTFRDGTGNTQKLSVDDVLSIRSRFVRHSYHRSNIKELAEEYGLHPKYVWRIVNGKALSHVH